MRRARMTYPGAFHHVMNRGHGGEAVFSEDDNKKWFLRILSKQSQEYRIKLLVYSIMDNHYHIILQNTSGKLSDFMRQVNGLYGRKYRNSRGGRGYVFQDRYKSLLIQDGSYLAMASVYVLINCVAGGIVKDPFEYRWSSIGDYFSGKEPGIVDNVFMEKVFGSKEELRRLLRDWSHEELPITRTRLGSVLGEDGYIKEAEMKFDRRKMTGQSRRMRRRDYIFETTEKVVKEFEDKHKISIGDINTSSCIGKRLRSELLVLMKDRAGLSYREIVKFPIFMSLKYSSLGQIYKRAKKRVLGNK
jgi:putative transposase